MEQNNFKRHSITLMVDNRCPADKMKTENVEVVRNQAKRAYFELEDYLADCSHEPRMRLVLFDEECQKRVIHMSPEASLDAIDREVELVEDQPSDLNEMLSEHISRYYVSSNYRWMTVVSNHHPRDWAEVLPNHPSIDASRGRQIEILDGSCRVQIDNRNIVVCDVGCVHDINWDLSLVTASSNVNYGKIPELNDLEKLTDLYKNPQAQQ